MDEKTLERYHRHPLYMSLGIICGAEKGIPEAQFLMAEWHRHNGLHAGTNSFWNKKYAKNGML